MYNYLNMKTPYFVIIKSELDDNINSFSNALKRFWPNSLLAYSVKTNSLPWLLSYLQSKGVYAEVVSDEEYQLAEMCGFSTSSIIFNGPIKSKEAIVSAINHGSIVNIDSKNDLKVVEKNLGIVDNNIGVRVNVDPSRFLESDIDYLNDGFRFGFSDETGELYEAIKIIRSKSKRIGLHLHCNSITRSLDIYSSLSKYAAELIEKYNLQISYIDIGGGFFGGVPGKPSAEEYIEAITRELAKAVDINTTKLIVEPGSAIICSAVDFVTSVIDVKDTSKSRIVTTDGSRINIDPLWKKRKYQYTVIGDSTNPPLKKQIVCGYTCMDHDRIMDVYQEKELKIGNRIIYHKVGAYSMTFGGMFIRAYPDVYVAYDDKIEQVRNRIDVAEIFKINT